MTVGAFPLGCLFEMDGEHNDICGGPNRDAAEQLAGVVSVPDEALALLQYLPAFKDQGSLGDPRGSSLTCAAHGIANGAETRLRALGFEVPPSAIRQIYTLSNQLLRSYRGERLQDVGTYPRVAMKACAEWGVAPDSAWPFRDPVTGAINDVTKDVPPDVLQKASAWKLKEQTTIYATGAERVRLVCAALAPKAGMPGEPIPCAGPVDRVFMSYGGHGVLPAPDPNDDLGGHMVCIICFRTNAQKKREFLIRNSWPGWGFTMQNQESLGWCSEEWLMAQRDVFSLSVTRH